MLDPLRGERLRAAAVALLARRPYTVQRLRAVLIRRAASADDVHDVLATLQDQGLLDDHAYAVAWVEEYGGERGARRIAADLRARGVHTAAIDEATAGLPDEHDTAVALLRRHSARYADLDPPVARRRALGFLQRRGFGADAAYGAVRSVLDAGDRFDD